MKQTIPAIYSEYIVSLTHRESPTTMTISLAPKEGNIPLHIPGQFINVYFPELDTPEGKAYSISSAPNGNNFSITVRGIGAFSNRLCALSVGETLNASLPYGFFSPAREDSDLVLIASGIGVAPFRSIILSVVQSPLRRRIALFHSVRIVGDAFFHDEFETIKNVYPELSLRYFVTREHGTFSYALPRRMNVVDVLSHIDNLDNPEFLICGSISFTGDMWKALKQSGVPQDSIYTEAFFSH